MFSRSLKTITVTLSLTFVATFVPSNISQAARSQPQPAIRKVDAMQSATRSKVAAIQGQVRGLPIPAKVAQKVSPVVVSQVTESSPRVDGAAPIDAPGDIPSLIRQHFPNEQDKALRVAKCESNFNPNARNGSHYGLYQISVKYHSHRIAKVGRDGTSLFDPLTNILVAKHLRDEQGWRPWVCK